MGEITAIEWCDHTFNPWWGCARVSPACNNCYAEAFAKRTGHDVWGKNGERRFFGDGHWAEPHKWNRQAEAAGVPAKVFCASMADVFEDLRDLDEHRARLFALAACTPWLRWLLLTKRPEKMVELAPPGWADGWPPNVWAGTTVEDQQRAEERIPHLLRVPARIRFLSCEPLLEPVELRHLWTWCPEHDWDGGFCTDRGHAGVERVHWVICGGESGPRHRPLAIDAVRTLRGHCLSWGVAFFFKQVGGRTPKAGGRWLDGREWSQFPAEAFR